MHIHYAWAGTQLSNSMHAAFSNNPNSQTATQSEFTQTKMRIMQAFVFISTWISMQAWTLTNASATVPPTRIHTCVKTPQMQDKCWRAHYDFLTKLIIYIMWCTTFWLLEGKSLLAYQVHNPQNYSGFHTDALLKFRQRWFTRLKWGLQVQAYSVNAGLNISWRPPSHFNRAVVQLASNFTQQYVDQPSWL